MDKKMTGVLMSLSVLFSSSFGSVWAEGFAPVEVQTDGAPVPAHLSDLPLAPMGQEGAVSLPLVGMEESLQFEDSLGAIQSQIPLDEKKNAEEKDSSPASAVVSGHENVETAQDVYNKETTQNLSPAGDPLAAQEATTVPSKPLKKRLAFISSHLKKAGARFFDRSKDQSPLSALQFSAEDAPRAVADVNARNMLGETSLMMAAVHGNANVISRLLKAGADVNARDILGETALMMAAGSSDVDVISRLLKAGADVNARNKNGKTALMMAAVHGNANVISRLLKAGADVNARNRDGMTALVIADQCGNADGISLLLKAGARR